MQVGIPLYQIAMIKQGRAEEFIELFGKERYYEVLKYIQKRKIKQQ